MQEPFCRLKQLVSGQICCVDVATLLVVLRRQRVLQ